MDATIEKALGEEFGVQGFPTLKYFKVDEANLTFPGIVLCRI